MTVHFLNVEDQNVSVTVPVDGRDFRESWEKDKTFELLKDVVYPDILIKDWLVLREIYVEHLPGGDTEITFTGYGNEGVSDRGCQVQGEDQVRRRGSLSHRGGGGQDIQPG